MALPDDTPELQDFRESVRDLIRVNPENFMDQLVWGCDMHRAQAEMVLMLAEWGVADVMRLERKGPGRGE